jgi:hypothetical protein
MCGVYGMSFDSLVVQYHIRLDRAVSSLRLRINGLLKLK